MLVIYGGWEFYPDSVVALGVTVNFYVGLSCASLQNVSNLFDFIFSCIAIGQKSKCLCSIFNYFNYVSNCLLDIIL